MRKIAEPNLDDIPDEYPVFKIQLAFYKVQWFNNCDSVSIEGYENKKGNKFYAIIVHNKIEEDPLQSFKSINLLIQNEYSKDDASDFMDFICNERIKKFYSFINATRFLCQSVHRDLAVQKFEESVSKYIHQRLDLFDHNMMIAPCDIKPVPSLPTGYSIRVLEACYASFIAPYWANDMNYIIDNDTKLEFFTNILIEDMNSERPRYVIFHEKSSNPVAWIKAYFDGAFGSLHVVEEHRGKGLARILIRTLVRNIIDVCGVPPFANCLLENSPSIGLLKSEGFEVQPLNYIRFFWKIGDASLMKHNK